MCVYICLHTHTPITPPRKAALVATEETARGNGGGGGQVRGNCILVSNKGLI